MPGIEKDEKSGQWTAGGICQCEVWCSVLHLLRVYISSGIVISYIIYNIILAEPGGKFQKKKHIEPIEMKRLWFDVTHLFEEFLLAFD